MEKFDFSLELYVTRPAEFEYAFRFWKTPPGKILQFREIYIFSTHYNLYLAKIFDFFEIWMSS